MDAKVYKIGVTKAFRYGCLSKLHITYTFTSVAMALELIEHAHGCLYLEVPLKKSNIYNKGISLKHGKFHSSV